MKKLRFWELEEREEREKRKEGLLKDNETYIVMQLPPPSTLFL